MEAAAAALQQQQQQQHHAANLTNASHDYITYLYTEQEYQLVAQRPDENTQMYYAVVVATYCVSFLVGVVCNCVVIFFVVVSGMLERVSRNITSNLLANLAAADLLLMIFVLPLKMKHYLPPYYWTAGETWCKATSYVETLSPLAAVFSLTMTSIERYVVIVQPMRSLTLCTATKGRLGIVGVWVFALLLSLPAALLAEQFEVVFHYIPTDERISLFHCENKYKSGTWQREFLELYFFLVFFLIPMCIMVYSYTRVIWELQRSKRCAVQTPDSPGMVLPRSNSISFDGRPLQLPLPRHIHADDEPSPTTPLDSIDMGGRDAVNGSHCLQLKSSLPSSPKPLVDDDHAEPPAVLPANGRDSLHGRVSTQLGGLVNGRVSLHGRASVAALPGVHVHPPQFISKDTSHARQQVIKMLVIILALFALCWGPNVAVRVVRGFGLPSHAFTDSIWAAVTFMEFLPFVHSCVNPCVYAFMSRNYRYKMTRVLKRCRDLRARRNSRRYV